MGYGAERIGFDLHPSRHFTFHSMSILGLEPKQMGTVRPYHIHLLFLHLVLKSRIGESLPSLCTPLYVSKVHYIGT
jgi:hypothetical protein